MQRRREILMPYAHPEALVSTEWLAAHLEDPQVRVLDASYKQPGITPTAREDYQRGHIPGAVFFDIDDVAQPGTSLPHMIPSPVLLDGGLPKWQAEGRPLDTALPVIPPRHFTARFRPALVRDKQAIRANLA